MFSSSEQHEQLICRHFLYPISSDYPKEFCLLYLSPDSFDALYVAFIFLSSVLSIINSFLLASTEMTQMPASRCCRQHIVWEFPLSCPIFILSLSKASCWTRISVMNLKENMQKRRDRCLMQGYHIHLPTDMYRLWDKSMSRFVVYILAVATFLIDSGLLFDAFLYDNNIAVT